jgi:hypothetical protein
MPVAVTAAAAIGAAAVIRVPPTPVAVTSAAVITANYLEIRIKGSIYRG